jgi:hypothetical protein
MGLESTKEIFLMTRIWEASLHYGTNFKKPIKILKNYLFSENVQDFQFFYLFQGRAAKIILMSLGLSRVIKKVYMKKLGYCMQF